MISTAELLKQTGIRSGKTLTRWHQAELIPPPTIGVHASGRGKSAYYPDWVAARCIKIRQMVNRGESLSRVRDVLGNDWDEEDRQHKKKYSLKKALALGDRQESLFAFDELLWAKLEPLIASMKDVTALGSNLTQLVWGKETDELLQLTKEGCNLVLVTNGTECMIMPDFLVSSWIADFPDGAPLIVVSIRNEIVKSFALSEEMHGKPLFSPCSKVRMTTAKGNRELGFRLVGDGFEVGSGRGSVRGKITRGGR